MMFLLNRPRRAIRAIAALAFASLMGAASPALAYSGSDLLEAPSAYGRGYVWGAANVFMSIGGDDVSLRVSAHRRLCLADSGITDGALFGATISHIVRTPKALTENALFAVNAVLLEMCGLPEGQP